MPNGLAPYHVALVSETKQLPFGDLTDIGAAVQKQVLNDFSPLWGISASVDVFATMDQVPIDYWHVMIADEIDDPTAEGYHRTDNGQPFAMIAFDDDCSVQVSHEVLEMLADPFGSTMQAGESVTPDHRPVQFLVEVCDPVQTSSYAINGINVCDFYARRFFDSVATPGVQYSLTGRVTAPRQILEGGYLTFFDPTTAKWWQQRWFDGKEPQFFDVSGENNLRTGSLRQRGLAPREMIDRVTPSYRRLKRSQRVAASRPGSRAEPSLLQETQSAHCALMRKEMNRILRQSRRQRE